MEPADRAAVGGIFGLCEFLTQEGVESALAYDLMQVGRSIHDAGSPRLSWLEVKALIRHSAPNSALAGVFNDMAVFNSPEFQINALIADLLGGANWQRSGGKGPKPIPVMKRLKQSIERAKQDALAPKSASDLAAVRESLRRRRKHITSA